jgi:hypothetical protein
MKTSTKIIPVLTAAIVGVVVAGCSNLPVPRANRYHVEVNQVMLEATSIKAHGKWIEIHTDRGEVMWCNERYVKTITPIQ